MMEMVVNITLPTLGKPVNVKDAIISILSAEWPLTVKMIYNKVGGMGLDVSYQAVYKSVAELSETGITEKSGNKYRLSEAWAVRLGEFSSKLISSFKDKPLYADGVLKNGCTNISFSTPMELGDFFVDMLECTSSGRERIVAGQWKFMTSPMFYSKRYLDRLRKIMEKDRFYFVGRENSFITRWLARSWESLGAKVRLGVDCASSCDIVVVEDTIIQVFWSAPLKKMFSMASYLKKIRSTDMSEVYHVLTQEITEINVIAIRNPKVAGQIRDDTLEHFKNGG